MKKTYITPIVEAVLVEDKDSVTMATNNIKTFVPNMLSDSCGFTEADAALPGTDLSTLPADAVRSAIEGLTSFSLVAS